MIAVVLYSTSCHRPGCVTQHNNVWELPSMAESYTELGRTMYRRLLAMAAVGGYAILCDFQVVVGR